MEGPLTPSTSCEDPDSLLEPSWPGLGCSGSGEPRPPKSRGHQSHACFPGRDATRGVVSKGLSGAAREPGE